MQQYLEQLYTDGDSEALKNEYIWMQEHYKNMNTILREHSRTTNSAINSALFTKHEVEQLCGMIQGMVYCLGMDIEDNFKN